MASTTLFAPQVRAAQPAFVYNGAFEQPYPQSYQIILKIDLNKSGSRTFFAGPLSGKISTAEWGDGTTNSTNGHTYKQLGVYTCKLTLRENMLPEGAFKNKPEIIEIIIGDGIITIGNEALDCQNVNKIYSSNKNFSFTKDHFDGENMKEIIYIQQRLTKIYLRYAGTLKHVIQAKNIMNPL